MAQSVFERTDEELKKSMESHFTDPTYRVYFDVLQLRHYEKLVKETNQLARTSWFLVVATWALVISSVFGPTIFKLLPVN